MGQHHIAPTRAHILVHPRYPRGVTRRWPSRRAPCHILFDAGRRTPSRLPPRQGSHASRSPPWNASPPPKVSKTWISLSHVFGLGRPTQLYPTQPLSTLPNPLYAHAQQTQQKRHKQKHKHKTQTQTQAHENTRKHIQIQTRCPQHPPDFSLAQLCGFF